MSLKVEYKWAEIIELEPVVLDRLKELPKPLPWPAVERRQGERRQKAEEPLRALIGFRNAALFTVLGVLAAMGFGTVCHFVQVWWVTR